MQNELYNTDVIENSAESYLWNISSNSQAIYLSLLAAVMLALFSLPLIFVDVVVPMTGIIRSAGERNEIKPLVAGTIDAVMAKENQYVSKGKVLLRMQTDALDTKIRLNQVQQMQKQQYIQDLSLLVHLNNASRLKVKNLQSPLYRQQYAQLVQEISGHGNIQRKKQQEFTVAQYLYQKKVLTKREYEDKEYELRNVQVSYQSVIEQRLSQWQADLNTYTYSLIELQAEEKQLLKEKELYTIKAPIGGTLQQFAGKYVGSYLQVGEMIAIISPDSNLIAECYVSPKDIGQIHKGMSATFQIDAFDYNEWGTVSGRVTDIAKDVILLNNQPVFKITCQLNNTYLQLKNSYRGDLKKGMTLQARFSLTKRSLFQLLFDKADDWLNPLQANKQYNFTK
jgi:multidrug resistance efflux pump